MTDSGGPGQGNGMANVVIVGGTEETRLLLRGLLRLYRHRVVADGPRFDVVTSLATEVRPAVAVVDIDIEDPQQSAEMVGMMRHLPAIHVLLLSSERTARTETRAKELGIDCVICRPFAVHDLMEAVEAASAASGRTTSPDRQP
ncbi:MAG: hypothetical protein L3K17_03770 [Thermoplasmata archaeon]|nr:hypothetical protein [Thermoplasmata archaeon]